MTISKAFEVIKPKLCEASILALPNFDKLFKVGCYVSGLVLGLFLLILRNPWPILVRSLKGGTLHMIKSLCHCESI